MENLNKALKSMSNQQANDVFQKISKADSEYMLEDFLHESVRKIGGYYNGSDIFDNGDDKYAKMLLDGNDDFSLDYDQISDLKEAYANDVIGKMKDFDLTTLASFEKLFNYLKENDSFDGDQEELAAVLRTSTDFAEQVYEALNQPRG